MPAGDVFKGKEDEDEGGNFQHPKGEHGHGVRGEELQQCGQEYREDKANERRHIGWKNQILAKAENKDTERNGGHEQINHAARKKQEQAVGKVIDGFDEELADVAVFNICGDLPVVLADGGEDIHEGDDQVIGGHLGECIAADTAAVFAGVNGAPKIDGRQQGDETKNNAEQKTYPVG